MIGAVSSAGVLCWVQQHTDVHFLLYACIDFLTCTVIGWIVSVLLPAPSKALNGLTIYAQAW